MKIKRNARSLIAVFAAAALLVSATGFGTMFAWAAGTAYKASVGLAPDSMGASVELPGAGNSTIYLGMEVTGESNSSASREVSYTLQGDLTFASASVNSKEGVSDTSAPEISEGGKKLTYTFEGISGNNGKCVLSAVVAAGSGTTGGSIQSEVKYGDNKESLSDLGITVKSNSGEPKEGSASGGSDTDP